MEEGSGASAEDTKPTLKDLFLRSLKRTMRLFKRTSREKLKRYVDGKRTKLGVKINDEYEGMRVGEPAKKTFMTETGEITTLGGEGKRTIEEEETEEKLIDEVAAKGKGKSTRGGDGQLQKYRPVSALSIRGKQPAIAPPQWHAPWKLMRVISGHNGHVHCVDVDPMNEWFVTGSKDRTLKIWDIASGQLKLTLTGHISSIRGVAVSERSPYVFSCGEDKQVKCWDLEQNRVVRHYHGHLSGVYSIYLHPTLDLLFTGGRDSTVRVWDIRSKMEVHTLAGHKNTIFSILAQSTDPQVISGSADSTIRLWDLAAGKTMSVLTNHKKGVRALALHPSEFTFASGSSDNIKKWKCPEGKFMQNLSGHNTLVNTLAANQDNVLVSGGDNGSMYFWDWKTGYNFQRLDTIVQPGSLESEAGVFALKYDKTGSRLISCEGDKTIKIYKEDENATPESHPIRWKPDLNMKKF